MKKLTLLIFLSLQLFAQMGRFESGGPILPEQAAYDVKFYELDLKIDPAEKFISGSVYAEVLITGPVDMFILQLDSAYTIHKVLLNNKEVNFIHSQGLIKAEIENTGIKIGEILKTKVFYEGHPPVSRKPPWDEGFNWEKTKGGEDWVSVSCQGGGGDVWWPCKDHPSDEPDSVSLKFTVPSNLICASNGRLLNETDNGDGTTTFHWFVSTPINNYDVTLNIAPYRVINHTFESVAGDKFPVSFYVLPESYDTAKVFTDQFLDHLRFYEKYCGPYPFRADKYGIAETSYLGMEHQTIIAYGNGYKNNEFGFDWLHHHELSHEWWGNMVTAKDWSDFWIHEGIGTYMQALYAEELHGKDGLMKYMESLHRFMNNKPIKQEGSKTAGEAYIPDIYNKGAWIIHTLRYYLGDEMFFKVLRRWAYPDPEMEKVTDGSQCRFITTKGLIKQTEELTGKKLGWFFDTYLRYADLPELEAVLIEKENENELRLQWRTDDKSEFILPVQVRLGNEIKTVSMEDGTGTLTFSPAIQPEIDPDDSILMKNINLKKYSKKGF